MGNPFAGDVEITLDGQRHLARLTLGALAELETTLEAETLVDLVERFESGRFSSRDVLALIVAGLRGGGWQGSANDLRAVEIGTAEIGGGALAAAQIAAQLLARAFTLPTER